MTESGHCPTGRRGNTCVLEGCVRVSAFQHGGRDYLRRPPGCAARMDASPNLRVVVFESANPDFYLAHFGLTGKRATS